MAEKIIGVTELQRSFRRVLDEVVRDGTPYVLTRGSRPEAVIVPYEEYRKSQAARELEITRRFDEAMQRLAERNARYGEAEIDADVEEARDEVARGCE